jgi:hypothetical protein
MSGPLPLGVKVRPLPPFDTLASGSGLEVAGVQFVDADGEISELPTGRWQYLVTGTTEGELVAFASEYVEPI